MSDNLQKADVYKARTWRLLTLMSDSPTAGPKPVFVCDCEDHMRSVCASEPFYKENDGKKYCIFHYPGKEKSGDFKKAVQRKIEAKDFNFTGVWFPDELYLTNFRFTSGADFSFATFAAKVDFRSARFGAQADFHWAIFCSDGDFTGVNFRGEANFFSAKFEGGANFTNAIFHAAAYFEDAIFLRRAIFYWTEFSGLTVFRAAAFHSEGEFFSAKFNKTANFSAATFVQKAIFCSAKFSLQADFSSVRFDHYANFNDAHFDATADFSYAVFNGESEFASAFKSNVSFSSTTLGSYARFAGIREGTGFSEPSSLNLKLAKIEKPDRVSFHTLNLRPHWFVDVDVRKFDFTNVTWAEESFSARHEIQTMEGRRNTAPHRMLAITCRNLALNAEENHRYEEASKFRYMAMDTRRLETWLGFAPWRLSWWYWLASGYGERVLKAFLVLLGILLLFAVLYTQVGFARWDPKLASESDVAGAKRDDVGATLKFTRALTYSAAVMTFQKPEPRPVTTAAQTVVLLETIIGPVQAALLALAIRRKFMR